MDGLQQAPLGDAGQRETGLVQRLGALGGGADADRRERMADAREEAAFLGQRAGVGHDAEGVHLQAVVVMEAQRLMLNDALVELKAALLQTLAAARMAGVEDRHIVLFGHLVDGGEQRGKVLLGVDILLAVGRQQNVLALLETQTLVDIGRLDFFQILVQHLGHRGTGHVGTLLRQAGVGQITAGMLGVGHVHIGDDVHDAAVRLLGQALVLAAVAGLHVEDGDVEPLGRDGGQAAVGVAQDEEGIRPRLHHQLIGGRDDVAHGLAEVRAHGVQIDVGVVQRQVAEEDAVERIVVVLPGMRQQAVEVAAALLDDLGQADDLGAGAHDDE